MPVYEFECPACGCRFEVKLGFDDRSLIRCPKCKTEGKRLLSAFSFHFKEGHGTTPVSKVNPRARRVQ